MLHQHINYRFLERCCQICSVYLFSGHLRMINIIQHC